MDINELITQLLNKIKVKYSKIVSQRTELT